MTGAGGELGDLASQGGMARARVVVVPNLLSLARLGLAAAFPFAPTRWRAAIIVAAALSDLLDGAWSRLFRARSMLGQLLDPIADKAFVASVLLTLLAEGTLRFWQLAAVGARDLAVLGGSAWVVATRGWSAAKALPPRPLGKLATAAQFAFLLAVAHWQSAPPAVFYPTAALSILAGIDYLIARRRKRADATAQLQHP